MPRRIVLLLAGALLGLGHAPAQAAGCVLAADPPGDTTPAPGLDANLDILELRVEVTGTAFRFSTRLDSVPETPPPSHPGYLWQISLTTAGGREAYVYAFRTFQGDGAAAGHRSQSGTVYEVPYRLHEAAGTVYVEMPYDRAGLRRGETISNISVESSAFYGVVTPYGDSGRITGRHETVDDATSTRRLVVGVGCR